MKELKIKETTCKSCNTKKYSRKCILMRHIKKCDPSISTYIDYIIKYEYNNILPICSICNDNDVEIMKTKISDYCHDCYVNKMKKILSEKAKERFSDENTKKEIFDKRIKTNLKKYGVEHISQLEEIKNKVKETVFSKYGVSSGTQVESVKKARIKALDENKYDINEKRKKAWDEDLKHKVTSNRIKTLQRKYGISHPSQLTHVRKKSSIRMSSLYEKDDHFKNKIKSSIIDKYGVEYVSQSTDIKKKIKDTSFKKYNSRHYLSSNLRRNLMIEQKKWLPDHLLPPFKCYKRKCWRETKKHIDVLFSSWDGNCFYTRKPLLTDKKDYNNPLYRTIDHKISMHAGFIKNISTEIIGNLDNLCICSRSFNSKKNTKSYKEFV